MSDAPAGPIPTSRLLVGLLLHVCVPAYLLACLAAALFGRPVVAGWGEVPARMLWTAAWFVPSYLLATIAAGGLGVWVDRRRPRVADEPVVARRHLASARGQLAALGDPRIGRALERIDAARPDLRDPACRQIAADLDAAARTFATSLDSAGPERRSAILALAAESVERLAAALEQIADERGRLDEGDARTVATYLRARYGDAD